MITEIRESPRIDENTAKPPNVQCELENWFHKPLIHLIRKCYMTIILVTVGNTEIKTKLGIDSVSE